MSCSLSDASKPYCQCMCQGDHYYDGSTCSSKCNLLDSNAFCNPTVIVDSSSISAAGDAACNAIDSSKPNCIKCDTGLYYSSAGGGACLPVQCIDHDDCDEECKIGTCTGSSCSTVNMADGSTCDYGAGTNNGNCQTGVCIESCTANSEKRCVGSDLYWYDSCGIQGSEISDCGYYECKSQAGDDVCETSCSSDTDCAGTNHCSDSNCCLSGEYWQNVLGTWKCKNLIECYDSSLASKCNTQSSAEANYLTDSGCIDTNQCCGFDATLDGYFMENIETY